MATNAALLALAELMKSEEYSDLTFSCNDRQFKVHKNVVCGQSPVIRAALSEAFEEGHSSVIKMHSFDHETVKRLVQFFYTGDYDVSVDDDKPSADAGELSPDGGPSNDDDPSNVSMTGNDDNAEGVVEMCCCAGLWYNCLCLTPQTAALYFPDTPCRPASVDCLKIHIKVNSIGDYYGVTKLMSLANSKIKALLQIQHEGDDLHSNPCSWVTNLPAATKLALESTGDSELRRILAAEIAANISALTLLRDFKNLEDISDFSFNVLQGCAKEIQRLIMQNNELEDKIRRWKEDYACKRKAWEGNLHLSEGTVNEFIRCAHLLQVTDNCRNCVHDFGGFIDQDVWVVRCKKCKCKH
ncbi:hypothetical protein XA68_17281 [Ophiocordyceps unilateralis]|uniref:BTB domain-containing protein n=1 Tax=Ophiocordyceps unilateralis TaxID=268505 RepID=A0A2A9PSC9_OPHUN|nr:hypothetical protein XA68_17281 [Ophiocordyceps unilateralis]